MTPQQLKAMKMALEALEDIFGKNKVDVTVINVIKEALAEHAMRETQRLGQEIEQEPVAVYGYCPECGAKGVMRERRPNGNDKCANGHTYPSSTSTPPQRKPLTDDLYNELLFAVENKYPDETRHQTALRYIKQAEMPSARPAQAAHGIKENT